MSSRSAPAARAATALAAALLVTAAGGAPAAAQDWHTVTYSRVARGEDALRVDVEYGAGQLQLGPSSGDLLYRASLRFDREAFRPDVQYADGRLRVRIEGNRNVRGRNLRESRLDLRLSPDVPLDLRVAFGAADASIELGGIRVRRGHIQTGASRTTINVTTPNPEECERFEIEVGAAKFEAQRLANLNARRFELRGGVGEVILDFSGEWRGDMSASIDMGLGSLTLKVPRGLGVRVRKDGILAAFDSQGLVKRGNVYYSEGFEGAAHKLDLDLGAALGSIRVEWVDA